MYTICGLYNIYSTIIKQVLHFCHNGILLITGLFDKYQNISFIFFTLMNFTVILRLRKDAPRSDVVRSFSPEKLCSSVCTVRTRFQSLARFPKRQNIKEKINGNVLAKHL